VNTPGSTLPRKTLGRRAQKDYSQPLRRTVQFAFLALNLWIGVQFFLFVRYYETGGQSVHVGRPAGVEGWLPEVHPLNLASLI
jgi:hypothetical protein